MKKLLFTLPGILLFSCSDKPHYTKPETKVIVWSIQIDSVSYETLTELNHMEILTIDSCEYIYNPNGGATTMTHKGNCKNHKR